MKQKSIVGIVLLLFLALALAACSQETAEEVQNAVEEAAPTIEAAATQLAPTIEAAATRVVEAVQEQMDETEDLPDLGGREVTIAVENAYLPFNYIDPNTGEPAGWDYDAWDTICELLNCTPVYVEAAWEGMIQAVSDGQYDAAADGITINDERAQLVDFSDGYISIEQRLLVRLDEDRFSTVDEVVADDNLIIGTQTGTTNYQTAEEYFGADRIQAFEQFGFAVQALIAGDV
ncbi:MAG: transporter substrate-binding domain-containing protein, partial [Chloroflexota bacterium]